MKIISITDEEIVFEAPIKPYIWAEWSLDKASAAWSRTYLGIRIYWTKMESIGLLKFAKPLD